ncbi:HpcH/HpaI aldolase/citrate lyase family protein [Streptomyces indicus]|uniref:Citrate lyase subunit beta / citryl-CoA lyase n=1 Tax=Streptomyces indicus TaxID=417292 RepID=A0A1G8Z3X9_9ACTN|nr:CoA ester lyase [Streptomyces indicus]SDK09055.1 citrate lyase subunit beta / citryl-CoA lyase [Streptomyces indicus]
MTANRPAHSTGKIPLTWLYVPGDRPERVAKALYAGADVVIVDLEDAVAPDRKAYARAATAELLTERQPVPVHVRINALNGPLSALDIEALAGRPGLSGLRLPKVTSPAQITEVAERADAPPLFALLESAAGVEQAYAIATAHACLRGISLGEADLRADLGVTLDSALDWSRSRIVCAARAARLPAPPQSVHPDIHDLDALAASCAHGRSLGFLGRAAIHPRQLPVIEAAYLPTPAEVTAAREIIAAAPTDTGALALPDGRFVDAAVVSAAERTLALSRRTPT